MKDLWMYWIVHRALQTSGWTDKVVQSRLKRGSMLEVIPEEEEPFYYLATYDAAKLMGVTKLMVKNARARENSIITWRLGLNQSIPP